MSLTNKYYIRRVHGQHVRRFIVTNHYAQRVPCIQFAFGLFTKSDKKMIGVMTFGQPPTPFLQIECPWTMLELNRIALIENQKNIVTWWISNCVKQLPQPTLLVSWADQNQGHVGYIYQAANWIYTGESNKTPIHIINGKIKHDRHAHNKYEYKRRKQRTKINQLGKHRYFYPLGTKAEKRKMKKYIIERFGVHLYPKGESKRYDMIDERIKKESIEMIKNRLF